MTFHILRSTEATRVDSMTLSFSNSGPKNKHQLVAWKISFGEIMSRRIYIFHLYFPFWWTINCYLHGAARCSGRIEASFKCVSWLFLAHVQSFSLILCKSHLLVGSFSSPTCWKLSVRSLISALNIREHLSTFICYRSSCLRCSLFFCRFFFVLHVYHFRRPHLIHVIFCNRSSRSRFFFLVLTANFQDLFGKYERRAGVKMTLLIHWWNFGWNIVGNLLVVA